MKLKLTVLTLLAAAFGWTAIPVGQEVRPVPGAGTGIVTVTGSVDIGNMPPVRQGSDWQVRFATPPDVRVASLPEVRVASPGFLKPRGRYEIAWAAGQSEDVVVVEVAAGAWARVESKSGRRRWVNVGQAQAVEEIGAGR